MQDVDREIFGTALLVGGTWYARLVDCGGVLVPFGGRADVLADLVHDSAYSFTGRVVADHRGMSREFIASAATRIGLGADD